LVNSTTRFVVKRTKENRCSESERIIYNIYKTASSKIEETYLCERDTQFIVTYDLIF